MLQYHQHANGIQTRSKNPDWIAVYLNGGEDHGTTVDQVSLHLKTSGQGEWWRFQITLELSTPDNSQGLCSLTKLEFVHWIMW